VIERAELAYLAAVVDTQSIIRLRTTGDGTDLPMLALHGPNVALLEWLAELTGTKVTVTRRTYSKHGCAEHCPEKHQHIVSTSGRWSVSGAKATIVLDAVTPYLRWQYAAAIEAVRVGVTAPTKPATARKMHALGWPIPVEWRDNPHVGEKAGDT
jgi:hypothetical protein